MIKGIGIDVIEIERFAHWHTYAIKQLKRIFSDKEIDYCLSVPALSAERFAARFAAREAAYKAVCQAYTDFKMPFLTFCHAITIEHTPPIMIINWLGIGISCSDPTLFLSMSHSKTTACALVVID